MSFSPAVDSLVINAGLLHSPRSDISDLTMVIERQCPGFAASVLYLEVHGGCWCSFIPGDTSDTSVRQATDIFIAKMVIFIKFEQVILLVKRNCFDERVTVKAELISAIDRMSAIFLEHIQSGIGKSPGGSRASFTFMLGSAELDLESL